MNIYEPSGRAKEYSPLSLNYFSGCTHNCQYCYVNRINMKSTNGITQSVCIPPKEEDFAIIENDARKFKGCNKQILLSFTGDPYCDVSPQYTRRVLEILNKYEHKVSILTKGGKRVLNDLDLFKKFKSQDLFSPDIERISVGATLTFDNDKDSSFWEPGAALPDERIETLKILSKKGIRTWASFEPVIKPEQSLNLLKQVSGLVHHVKIGKINDYKDLDKNIDWNKFISQAVKICRDEKINFYIKEDLRAKNRDTILSADETNPDRWNL